MLGFRDLAERLIAEHPEHLTVSGGSEVTPLHVAASAGHSDILLLLIEHGADVNGRGISSDTPLHRASLKARLEAGQFLLNRGADIDVQNDYNNTLH
jgi:ankyrin repeat protein